MKKLIAIAIVLLSCAPALGECVGTFEKLLAQIEVDDQVLSENTKRDFFVEEHILHTNGAIIDKQKLNPIPDKYKYEGRIYPSKAQQKQLGISLYIRRIVLKDVRVVTEKTKSGNELSSYWFWRRNGCWKLTSRVVNITR